MPIQATIAASYAELSDSLRSAADFVVENRLDVATRSLRSVAASSGVSPASFSRLARALGYENYEELREEARRDIDPQSENYSTKARKIRMEATQPGAQPFLSRQVDACLSNIGALIDDTDLAALNAAADRLATARKVVLIGALGSAGIADYFAYLVNWFADGWSVVGRNGVTLASALARLTKDDAVVVISKAPYASRSVRATKLASERGASVIVLTDSHAFPGLRYANDIFIQRSESPQFFESYAATVVLVEALAGMLVARAGPDAEARIQEIADENRLLEEFVAP